MRGAAALAPAKVSVFDPDSGMKTESLIAAAVRTPSSMPAV